MQYTEKTVSEYTGDEVNIEVEQGAIISERLLSAITQMLDDVTAPTRMIATVRVTYSEVAE